MRDDDYFLSPEWIAKAKKTVKMVDGDRRASLTTTLMFGFFIHLKECADCYNKYASIFDHIQEADRELIRRLEKNE
jgi:hypothetical protein